MSGIGQSDTADLSVGIVAGGKSSRMERDKAFLEWEDQSLIEHIAGEMSSFWEVMISCSDREKYAGLQHPLVVDEHKDAGPLEGIRRLLLAASCERVFICAVDMPHVTKELVMFLYDKMEPDTDCILAKASHGPEPLCAIYRKSALPAIGEMITKENYRIRDLFDKIKVQYAEISEGGFSADAVRNLNTWPEYMKEREKA